MALVGVVGERKGVARMAVMEMAVGTEASEGRGEVDQRASMAMLLQTLQQSPA